MRCMHQFLSVEDIHLLLRTWFPKGYRYIPLEKGLLNQNGIVREGSRTFLLKVYRPDMTQTHLHDVHAVMRVMLQNGVPVTHEEREASVQGAHVVLYAYLPGMNPGLYPRSLGRVHAMGDMLGRIHSILLQHQQQLAVDPLMEWRNLKSPEDELSALALLMEDVRRKKPAHTDELLSILDEHRSWIESHAWDIARFASLPAQLCHGDYHTKNILFQNATLTGVLDWEKYGWGTQVSEVMRSIVFNCRRSPSALHWSAVKAYVQAYRQHKTFSQEEARLAFPFVFQKMLFGTWAEKQYLAGDARLWSNVIRRQAINRYFVKEERRISARIEDLLIS